jgi:hypothetical protein
MEHIPKSLDKVSTYLSKQLFISQHPSPETYTQPLPHNQIEGIPFICILAVIVVLLYLIVQNWQSTKASTKLDVQIGNWLQINFHNESQK